MFNQIRFYHAFNLYPIQKIENINFIEQETRFAIADQQNFPGITAQGITEDFPLAGYRSLYGATKLASELMIQEYNHFYGINTVINRCGVLTGPWQMGKVDQGVTVLWVAKHFWKQQLSYIGYDGSGKQVRDLLHIEDLFRLIDFQIHHMERLNGEIFNVGGGEAVSVSLQELTAISQQITGNHIPINKVRENRQADIRIYITDNSKVTQLTGWQPQIKVEKILEDVYSWIYSNNKELAHILR